MLAVKKKTYRLATALSLVASLMLVWLSLGVGIIGKDGDPANAMYFGVVAVGIAGSIITRLRPRGMVWVLCAMMLAQAAVASIALLARLGLPWSGPAELIGLNGIFIALFAGAALLFHLAAGQ
ncbi:MAG TPA: hypothetical protein VEL28_00910 [Candidatus Binatia bacterium]|nr:hypothetical protein [Candidatus Binatia bacterium]